MGYYFGWQIQSRIEQKTNVFQTQTATWKCLFRFLCINFSNNWIEYRKIGENLKINEHFYHNEFYRNNQKFDANFFLYLKWNCKIFSILSKIIILHFCYPKRINLYSCLQIRTTSLAVTFRKPDGPLINKFGHTRYFFFFNLIFVNSSPTNHRGIRWLP